MELESLVAFSIVSELLFCLFAGFLLGWMIVLGTDTTTSLKVKSGVGFLFAAILFWLAYSAPKFLMTFYTFKPYFLLLLAMAMTYFYFDDPHLNKKQMKASVTNVIFVFIAAAILLLLLLFVLALVATLYSSWV